MKPSSGTGTALAVALAIPVIAVQFASLQIVAFAAAVGVLALTLLMTAATGRGLNRTFFFAAFAFLLFILTQIRPDLFVTWGARDAMFLMPVVVTLLAASALPTANSDLLYKVIYFASTGLCVLWILLHLTGLYPELVIFPPYAGTRWVGGFDGPNEFGQFYVLVMALGAGLYLEGKIKLLQLIVCTAILAVCVWYSFSRGALFAVAILSAAVVFLNAFGRQRWRLLFVGVGVLAAGSVYLERFMATFLNIRQARGGRDELLDIAIDIVQEKPFFGGGFGYFDSIAGLPPHSDYMYFAASGGILGLIVLCASFGYLLWGSYRRGMYAEFLFFVVFAVHSLSFNNLVRGRLSLIFWAVAFVALVRFVRWDQLSQAWARMQRAVPPGPHVGQRDTVPAGMRPDPDRDPRPARPRRPGQPS